MALYDFSEFDGSIVPDRSGNVEPLDLRIADTGSVRRSADGLEVIGHALIHSERPASRLIESIQQAGAITIEAWIRPANLSQAGPSRIVTLSRNPVERNFTLG